jgi:hypothetical protein
MPRIRHHLTYANVMATLAVFIALGGTAIASVIITSNSQVAQNTISGHKPPSGSINGSDIADRSGVDSCQAPLTKKYGPICAGTDGASRDWLTANDQCAQYDLRLPSLGEGIALTRGHVISGLSSGAVFWTDQEYSTPSGFQASVVAYLGGGAYEPGDRDVNSTAKTVCVTDPSA